MGYREATPKLPTKEEIKELYARYDRAAEYLQDRVHELHKLEAALWESRGPMPSSDDLGDLGVMIENLKSAHGVLGGKIKELKGLVDGLYAVKERVEARPRDA